MLPCPSKLWLGLECPGCGLQRAFLALMQGHFEDSFRLYPALLPLLVTAGLLAYVVIFRRRGFSKLLLALYVLDTVMMYGHFLLKIL
ncbi:MAG: DUF2752 domain-containing protein [Flavobacteriales bacterium]|nr:DUF2752 domain-containing protein [Flavobacteriales bacterium]MCX7649460.1 DUF2752 domain-containing protein [Flavobacteriales bacterium]MDW8431481.1 DUF2752 domain-containing protein [Flavobacteriales bacterium]